MRAVSIGSPLERIRNVAEANMLRASRSSQIYSCPPRRRGAAAVEFAVVSLVFFTFVLAFFEFGRALMVDYVLVNSARQACRAGIIPGATSSQITQTASTALTKGGVAGASVTVLVNGTNADASSAQSGDRISVSVSVPVASVSWVPFTRYLTGSLNGQYTLRRE